MVEVYADSLQKCKNINPKLDLSSLEKMLANLLDRLADNKYRQKVEAVYMRFF